MIGSRLLLSRVTLPLSRSSHHSPSLGFFNSQIRPIFADHLHYDEAIRPDPQYEDAYYNRGIAYDNLGQYEWAIQDYDQAIRLNPDYWVTYDNRSSSYDALGQHQKAQSDKDKVCSLAPTIAYC